MSLVISKPGGKCARHATKTGHHSSRPMKIFNLLAASAVLLLCNPAIAQESDDLRVRVGLGAQTKPEFIGADRNEWAPLWDFSIARDGSPFAFEAPDDSFDIKLFSNRGFSAGPVANIEGSRKESEVGAPVGKVPTTIEAGAFAQYDVSESIRLRTEVRQGIGGHKGLVASVGADHVWRDGDRYIFSVGPHMLFSNARYQRAWFGVGQDESAASGLPQYRPSGGLHALAATSGLHYQFTQDWGLFGFARYERLVGDAAKSPIVRELGSRSQLSAGFGLTYSFTVRR